MVDVTGPERLASWVGVRSSSSKKKGQYLIFYAARLATRRKRYSLRAPGGDQRCRTKQIDYSTFHYEQHGSWCLHAELTGSPLISRMLQKILWLACHSQAHHFDRFASSMRGAWVNKDMIVILHLAPRTLSGLGLPIPRGKEGLNQSPYQIPHDGNRAKRASILDPTQNIS